MKIDGHGVIPLPNTTIMRTILASDIITGELLDRLSVVDEVASHARSSFLTFSRWLLEFRTFSLEIARQTHKTTTLMKNITLGTVMIVHNEHMRRHILRDNQQYSDNIFTPSSFVKFAQRTLDTADTLPITRIFMDELNFGTDTQMTDVYNAINHLNERNKLAREVFILKVGTPVR